MANWLSSKHAAVTENGPDDPVVDSGASNAEKPNLPADRPTDPVNIVAADAGDGADVIIFDDPAPLSATSCCRVVENHVPPVLISDSRVGPPLSDDDSSVGNLITSLYQRIAFQVDWVTSYQDVETVLRI